MTPVQFRERIAQTPAGQPVNVLVQEAGAISISDFLPGVKVSVNRFVTVPHYSGSAIAVESTGNWEVRDGKFARDVTAAASTENWQSCLTPQAYCDLFQSVLKAREEKIGDVRFDQMSLAPRADLAFSVGYALTPPEQNLAAACMYAMNTEQEISRSVFSAANRLDAHLKAEQKRIEVRTNKNGALWVPSNFPFKRAASAAPAPNTPDLAREIFDAAEAFRDAGFVLDQRMKGLDAPPELKWLLRSPVITNAALAVELRNWSSITSRFHPVWGSAR